ncbi:tyrosine-type recombinase/integrase [Legionella feeleii]|uniref:Integrase n=1 Tax=Legionella feeleii TaxID=453 RepID=A0A378IR55_9GAMM|nr:integrase arm-type DNA-binding domain-containing protein [Legionella feeleii]STX37706.1 integrase [Legionella feeleii]
MLTDLQIKALKPKDGKPKRKAICDGLVIEARPSGKKVFIFRFQWNKKPQTITLGIYSKSFGLAEARALALKYREQVENGEDPRKGSENLETKTTFKQVAEQWFQKYKGTWKDFARDRHSKSLTRDIYPFIGDKPIDEITKGDLLNIIHPHEELGHHDVAHRIFSRLKTIFEFAVGSSLTSNYPFIGLQKALVPRPKAINQPAVSAHEAHEMLALIRNSAATKINKLYIELLAHLFTRPKELRFAQWCEFDLNQAEWNIPKERMKMAAPHWVPLSPQVLKLLKELRLITGFTPYLFNSPSSKIPQPISETSSRKLLHLTGYKDRHTLHGFRSLASSVLHEQANFKSDAIEAQLAHKVQGVRGIYLRADFKAERRELMNWYSNWLDEGTNDLSGTKLREQC